VIGFIPIGFYKNKGGGGGPPSSPFEVYDSGIGEISGPPPASTVVNLVAPAIAGDRLVVWAAHQAASVPITSITGITCIITGGGTGQGANRLTEWSGLASGGETNFTVGWIPDGNAKLFCWALIGGTPSGFAPSNPIPRGELSTAESHATNVLVETTGRIHIIATYGRLTVGGNLDQVGVPIGGWSLVGRANGGNAGISQSDLALFSKVGVPAAPGPVVALFATTSPGSNKEYISGGSSVIP